MGRFGGRSVVCIVKGCCARLSALSAGSSERIAGRETGWMAAEVSGAVAIQSNLGVADKGRFRLGPKIT